MTLSKKLTVLCCAALLMCSLGCTSKGAKKSATPQEAFDQLKVAAKDKNWNKFCGCLTPDSINGIAGGMAMAGGMMKMVASMPMGEDSEKQEAVKKIAGQFDSTLTKFGVTPEMIGEVNPMKMGDTNLLTQLGSKIEKKAEFIGAMMNLMEEMAEVMGPGAPGAIEFDDATLVDVKIDGDSATGTINNENGHSGPVKFKKIEGTWLIDLDLNG